MIHQPMDKTFPNGTRVVRPIAFSIPKLGDCDNPEMTLGAGCAAIEGEKYPWFLAEGTALGFCRDGGFIPWDTDLDVHFALRDVDEQFIASLQAELELSRFQLVRSMVYRGMTTQLAFRDSMNDGIIFDLMFFYRSADRVQYVHWSELGHQPMPVSLVESVEVQQFAHGRYPAPKPLEAYCEYRYGQTWRTPSRSRDNPCRVKT